MRGTHIETVLIFPGIYRAYSWPLKINGRNIGNPDMDLEMKTDSQICSKWTSKSLSFCSQFVGQKKKESYISFQYRI